MQDFKVQHIIKNLIQVINELLIQANSKNVIMVVEISACCETIAKPHFNVSLKQNI